MVTAQERAILRKAAEIKRAKNRETRMKIAAARKPGGKASRGRERDNAHLAFIRRLPCVATFIETGRLVYGCQAAHLRLQSAAHGKTEGGQRKPSDCWVTPLSAEQHRIQGDVKGEPRFWADLGVDPFELCKALYAVSGDEAAALKIIQALRADHDQGLDQ